MPRTDRTPRQRLNPAQRRASILDCARRAFTNRPYDQVAVSQIAVEAGASEALLYRYFDSKPGLYIAVLETVFDDLLASQNAAVKALSSQAGPKEKIRAALKAQLEMISDEPLLLPGNDPSDALATRGRLRNTQMRTLRELAGLGPKSNYPLLGLHGFLEAICIENQQAARHSRMRHDEIIEMAVGAFFGAIGDTGANGGAAPVRYNKFGNPI